MLFDQGTPAPLRHHVSEHRVDTLAGKGWSDKDIGEMLPDYAQSSAISRTPRSTSAACRRPQTTVRAVCRAVLRSAESCSDW